MEDLILKGNEPVIQILQCSGVAGCIYFNLLFANKMKSTFKIRKAEQQDFESINIFINKLEQEVFDKEKQQKIFLENLSNPKNIYLVATTNEKVIGFLSCHVQNLLHHNGAIGEIQEMFVVPKKRGLGIGKALVNELKTIAFKKKILQIEVTSNSKRIKAHSFYKDQKFKETHKKFVLNLKMAITFS